MKITSLLFAFGFGLIGVSASAAPVAKPKSPATSKAPLVWKPATAAQRTAAAASIRAQLEAFKRNDWAKAATYQSQGLRRNFGTIAQFRAVIETNYPQFANYKSVAFLQARALGDVVQIQTRLVGKDGVKLNAIYLMKKENGIYRVEGVQGGGVNARKAPLPRDPSDYV